MVLSSEPIWAFLQNVLAGIVAGVISGAIVLFVLERHQVKREDDRQRPIRKLFVESCARHLDDIAQTWGTALVHMAQLNLSTSIADMAAFLDAANRRLEAIAVRLGGSRSLPGERSHQTAGDDTTAEEATLRLLIANLATVRRQLEETLSDIDTAWRYFQPSASMDLLEFRNELAAMHRGIVSLHRLAQSPPIEEASTLWSHAYRAVLRAPKLEDLLARLWRSIDTSSSSEPPKLEFAHLVADQAGQIKEIEAFLAAAYPELDSKRILQQGD